MIEHFGLGLKLEVSARESSIMEKALSAHSSGMDVLFYGFVPSPFLTINREKFFRIHFPPYISGSCYNGTDQFQKNCDYQPQAINKVYYKPKTLALDQQTIWFVSEYSKRFKIDMEAMDEMFVYTSSMSEIEAACLALQNVSTGEFG